MANFIPREPGYVTKNNQREIICVIAVLEEFFLPFVLKDNRVKEAVFYKRKSIDAEKYWQMQSQVRAIFGQNKNLPALKKERVYALYPDYQDKNETRRLERLSNFKTSIMTNGSIETIRFEIKNDKLIEIHQNYPDIDSAIRGRIHTIEKYLFGKDCETEVIVEIEMVIAKASNLLLNWKGIDNPLIEEVEANIEKSAPKIKRARNIYKKNAFRQLEKIPGMRDVLGRINPGALAARTATARENIEKRAENLEYLISYTISLRVIMEKEKQEIEKNISLAKITLKALLDSPKTWDNHDFVSKKIKQVDASLRSVWANPFLSPARNAMCLLKEALKNISLDNPTLALANVAAALAYLES